MQLSKAFQPGLHIPLEEVTHLKCKEKTFSRYFSPQESVSENAYSCSVLAAVDGRKRAGGGLWSSGSHDLVSPRVRVLLAHAGPCVRTCVRPGSAWFRWMRPFLIGVFSKALLVQSLPVLVFFGEITNCSANPSQSSESQITSSARPQHCSEG